MELVNKIQKNLVEMKRFRGSLRRQVEELFNGIAKEFEDTDTSIIFEVNGRTFVVAEHYKCKGYGLGYLNTHYEFVEIREEQDASWEEYVVGFEDYDVNFSNNDIIFLAKNVEKILGVINDKLLSRLEIYKETKELLDDVIIKEAKKIKMKVEE